MNKKFLHISLVLFIIMVDKSLAASLDILAPLGASSNREPFPVTVYLDAENDVVGGVSGDISFPESALEIKSISTQGGVVSLWAISPKVSLDQTFDQKTHVHFEGVILGGFSGVITPYSKKKEKGILFTIEMIPKNQGDATIFLSNIDVRAYKEDAPQLPVESVYANVKIPALVGQEKSFVQNEKYIPVNDEVRLEMTRSGLVNNNSPYIFAYSGNASLAIDHMKLTFSNEYDPLTVDLSEWKVVTNPAPLNSFVQKKYVHVKIYFTNGAYTYKTLQTVENSHNFSSLSLILIGIVAVIFTAYHYGKKFFWFYKK